jgi:hypothetical protein
MCCKSGQQRFAQVSSLRQDFDINFFQDTENGVLAA